MIRMRFNIYNEHNELIGQDYQRNNGEWSHKWFDNNIRKLLDNFFIGV